MGETLGRLLTIGAEPADDEDTRLRKVLLLVAALIITPLAVAWGALYWAVGATGAAAIPLLYVGISLASLISFGLMGSYRWLAIGQFVPYMTLPFVLMWILGGFTAGSVVAIWAGLAPVTALLLGHRRAAVILAVTYAGLMTASAIVPTPTPPTLPAWLRDGMFPLNLTGVPVLALVLVGLFHGSREGSLASVRRIVRRYFSPDLAALLLTDPQRAELGGEIAH